MEKRKILIVDDEKDFCDITRMRVQDIGDFEIHTAFDGRVGIKMAKKIKPDLILLDIRMPGMDGYEVLKELKKHPETVRIPVVMLTAVSDEQAKVKASQLYDEGYLVKPIKPVLLKAKIEEILKRRRGT